MVRVFICNDYISITFCQSKTDPFWRGQSIHIHGTSTTTYPVRAMHNYHDMVTTQQPYDLVFSASTIEPLLCPQLVAIALQLLSQCCVCSSSYISHSFIIGAATMAVTIGLTPSLIKMLWRWNSNIYMAYVRSLPSKCHCQNTATIVYSIHLN